MPRYCKVIVKESFFCFSLPRAQMYERLKPAIKVKNARKNSFFALVFSSKKVYAPLNQKFMDKWHGFSKRKFGRRELFFTKIVSLDLKLS